MDSSFLEALLGVIAEAKRDDPLAPVTLIVPSGVAHLHLRRRLVEVSGAGLVNVRFLVINRLAELLGAASLAARGLKPLSPALRRLAVAKALAEAGDPFAKMAGKARSTGTIARQLRDLRSRELVGGESGQSRSDLPLLWRGLYEQYRSIVSAITYDEVDLYQAAAEACEATPTALKEFGRFVHLNPDDEPGPALSRFLAALGHHQPIVMVSLLELVRHTEPVYECFLTPDPEIEVELVGQRILEATAAGTPLARIAVLSGDTGTLSQNAERLFGRLGIPFNGRSYRHLRHTPLGSKIAEAVRLSDRRYAAEGLLRWIEIARPSKRAAWHLLVRKANVLAGLAAWIRGFERLAKDHPEATELGNWLQETDAGLARLAAKGTWSEKISALKRLIASTTELSRSTEDAAHWEPVERLSELSILEDAPSMSTFSVAFDGILDGPVALKARYGDGVYIGSLEEISGLDFDLLFLTGMSDDAYRDSSRSAWIGDDSSVNPVRQVAFERAKRSTKTLVCSLPRTKTSLGSSVTASRYYLEAIAMLVGRPVSQEALDGLPATPGLTRVASFREFCLAYSSTNPQAHGLKQLAVGLPPSPNVLPGWEVLEARNQRSYTEWEGVVGKWELRPNDFSVSTLETFAECPFKYFLQEVLKVQETEEAETRHGIDPSVRGRLFHEVLTTFLKRRSGQCPAEWSGDDEEELHQLLNEMLKRAAAELPDPDSLIWAVERAEWKRQLDRFLTVDAEFRKANKCEPAELEAARKRDLSVTGAVVGIKGRADRMDRTESGDRIVVDYKTGSLDRYNVTDADPTLQGKRLQLAAYAWLTSGNPVVSSGAYWGLRDGALPKPITLQSPPIADGPGQPAAVPTEIEQKLTCFVDAISQGIFPAVPGKNCENCTFCAYTAICPADRVRRFNRKHDLRFEPLAQATKFEASSRFPE